MALTPLPWLRETLDVPLKDEIEEQRQNEDVSATFDEDEPAKQKLLYSTKQQDSNTNARSIFSAISN